MQLDGTKGIKRKIGKKGRPPISDKIRNLIIEHALKDRDKPRATVANEITKLIGEMGKREITPSDKTLQKMISSARNHKSSPDDTPWHLGILNNREFPPLPPEAIPVLLRFKKDKGEKLTVRRAKWINRFRCTIANDDMLWAWSCMYAEREFIYEISNRPLWTEGWDWVLMEFIEYPSSAAVIGWVDKMVSAFDKSAHPQGLVIIGFEEEDMQALFRSNYPTKENQKE